MKDIGEASFPTPAHGIGGEDIVGEDQRTPAPILTYPFSAIASLRITAADNSIWLGTGWFISQRTLVTAGHCVFLQSVSPARRGFVKSIQVTLPNDAATATHFEAPDEWKDAANANHDYGVIVLDQPLQHHIAPFSVGVYTDEQLMAATANISGYPDDKADGTQWFHSQRLRGVNPTRVFYEVDTVGGQSGSPVWRIVNHRRVAFAVHTYGGRTTNIGTRITAAAQANINTWRDAI